MRVRATLPVVQLDKTTSHDSWLVVTSKTENLPNQTTTQPGVFLVCVDTQPQLQDTYSNLNASVQVILSQLGDQDKLGVIVGGSTPCVLVDATVADAQLATKTKLALNGLKNTDTGEGSLENLLHCASEHIKDETNVRIVVLTARQHLNNEVKKTVEQLPDNITVSFLAYTTSAASHQLAQLVHVSGGNFGFIDTPKDIINGLVEEFLCWKADDIENFHLTIKAKTTLATFVKPVLLGGQTDEIDYINDGEIQVAKEKLRGGRTYNWVLKIRVNPPNKNHARPISIFTLTISYVKNKEKIEQTFSVKVKFDSHNGVKDPEVVEIIELAVLREQLIETSELAADGHVKAARQILQTQKWESDKVWSISSEINQSSQYGSTLQALTYSGVGGTMVYNSGLLGTNAANWLPSTTGNAVSLVNKTMRAIAEGEDGETK